MIKLERELQVARLLPCGSRFDGICSFPVGAEPGWAQDRPGCRYELQSEVRCLPERHVCHSHLLSGGFSWHLSIVDLDIGISARLISVCRFFSLCNQKAPDAGVGLRGFILANDCQVGCSLLSWRFLADSSHTQRLMSFTCVLVGFFGMHPLIRIFLFVFFLFYFITGTNNAHYSKFEFGLFDILPAYGLPLLRHVQVLRSDNGG